jgi:DNA-binding CsgD family transcriptional regulator
MLVGRERERHALDGVIASVRSGRSAVLALIGEPGIGKTSLLSYVAESASDLALLRARGIESEMHLPFAGLYELLRPALHLIGRMPSPRAAALEGALALRPGTSGERFAVGAATLSLLAIYAEEQPAMLLIDDAHLLDPSTAEALRFALRRLLGEPLGAVLAVREEEPSLLDDADLPTMHIGGLTRDAAGALLGALAPETVDRLYRATAGNPLALTELARDTSRLATLSIDAPITVPVTISRAFARRAAALEPSARQLLVLATVDEAADLSTLERAARLLDIDIGGLTAAAEAGLVRLRDGRVEFRHPLARAAIYNTSPADVRRASHRAMARVLSDRDADRRAWHLAAAAVGTDRSASSALEQAAVRSRQRSAYGVASAAFETSARLADDDERRGRMLAAAAETAWLAGFADRAIALLDEARPLSERTDLLVQIDSLSGQIATRRGPVAQGYRILVTAAERIAGTAPELAVELLADAVDAYFYAGDAAGMLLTAQALTALVTADASVRAHFLAFSSMGMALVFVGDSRAGIESIRAASVIIEEDEGLREDTRLLPWIVGVSLWLRESGPLRDLVDEVIDTARARVALGILPWLLNRVGRDHAAAEDWGRARVEYDEAARLARETGQQTEVAAALASMAWVEARQGYEDDCRAHAAEAGTLCAELGVHLYEIWTLRALGELELGLGRASAAAEHLEHCTRRLGELGIQDVDLAPSGELVDAYLRLGRRDDATGVAALLDLEARRKGQPWSMARAARCLGMLARDEDFEPHFAEALRLHDKTPDVFELGLTRLAFGARLRRTRQRSRARTELRAAFAIFERVGAAPWAGIAGAELLATGETVRRRGASPTETLTGQELHIAQLLASGRTTREAAATLFLSPKTIEYHLRSVYGKLGINSRAELTALIGSPL